MKRHVPRGALNGCMLVAVLGTAGVAAAQDTKIQEWAKANRNFGMDDTTFRRLLGL